MARTVAARRWRIAFIIFALVYVGSYIVISRSMERAWRDYHILGFCYLLPRYAYRPSGPLINVLLHFAFYPVWVVDHYVFGGPCFWLLDATELAASGSGHDVSSGNGASSP